MTNSKAVYLRVSKEELDESKQLEGIKSKYDVKDAYIFREKQSAYQEDKQEKRVEFQRLKENIVEGWINEIYVYSIERIERNIIRLFEFFFFCEAHNVQIYSVMQNIPIKKENETPSETFLRYINVLLFGYKGQEESYTTSYRTKQAFQKKHNASFSYKGNKVGKPFCNLQGDKINLSAKKLNSLQKRIIQLINSYEEMGYKSYYKRIIDKIGIEFNLKISKSYISKLKNG